MLYSVNKMRKTKFAIIVAVAVVLSIATIGVVYAQYNTAQTNPNIQYTNDGDFWGWMGRCLRGYDQTNNNYQCQNSYQCQNGYQCQYNYPCEPINCYPTNAPQTTIPPQTTTAQTYAPQYPNQGYCQTGYGRNCGW